MKNKVLECLDKIKNTLAEDNFYLYINFNTKEKVEIEPRLYKITRPAFFALSDQEFSYLLYNLGLEESIKWDSNIEAISLYTKKATLINKVYYYTSWIQVILEDYKATLLLEYVPVNYRSGQTIIEPRIAIQIGDYKLVTDKVAL